MAKVAGTQKPVILQTVGTVLYKELVDNERGSSKLRAVVGTVIKEFPTTLEVPITTDFTIYVQLDYEGLHLRCFKCGSLDHKADDCSSGKKPDKRGGQGGAGRNATADSSEETSASTEQPAPNAGVDLGTKASQRSNAKFTKSQSVEVLEGRNLWRGEASKRSESVKNATEKVGKASEGPQETGVNKAKGQEAKHQRRLRIKKERGES
ncbi:hypothetical protein R1sor_002324 [Riccia sorocarpa]|uniref:CCHC-type domain-containing protein n=1 Tax=Riccia sorocarpa TaxID=122646 RepID=A0ABD3GYG6_9MARC